MIKKEKKNFVRIFKALFVLLLAVVMLLCVSCKKDENEDAETAEENKIAEMLAGNLNAYQVVRSETMKGDDVKAVSAFISVIQKNGYKDVSIVSDYVSLYPVIDTEIIVGETSRKGSVYNEGDGTAVAQTDNYSVYIVEKRLIVTYTDSEGLVEGLEYLLLCSLDAEQTELCDAYNMELFQRGIKRGGNVDFSVKNYLSKGSVLSANDDLRLVGTSTPGSTVTLQLTKGFEVLSSVDTTTDANGVWQKKIAPNVSADSILILVDGNMTERFEEISFKSKEINSCAEGTKVFINGKQVDVYVNEGGNYVISSLASDEEKMDIKLVRTGKVNDCTVRPLSSGIDPDISNKEIEFTVTEFPCKLSVEFEDFDEDPSESVQLFLYNNEEFVPNISNGKELIYFAPGEYWMKENMSIASNTTVYLAEGAVLHAKLYVKGAENVTIMGRGIIDTYGLNDEIHMMEFEECKNIILKDYTLTGPRKWMTVLRESEMCTVDTVNILGSEVNSDGVDIVGSQNVTVINCFLRTNDDCIAIKSGGSDSKNILVKGCVFWNENYGNALEIGFETRCDSIDNITFENNDIIYVKGACMSIHLTDQAHVRNVKYKDIRIENSSTKLVEYYIKHHDTYSKGNVRGKISDISMEGIVVLDDSIGSISLEGYGEGHIIDGISIGKIKFNGSYIEDISNIINKNKYKYAYDISYDGKTI